MALRYSESAKASLHFLTVPACPAARGSAAKVAPLGGASEAAGSESISAAVDQSGPTLSPGKGATRTRVAVWIPPPGSAT